MDRWGGFDSRIDRPGGDAYRLRRVLSAPMSVTLGQLGPRMAVFGLVLGAGALAGTRFGPPASGPIGRGQERAWRWAAIPLLVVGVAGLVIWAVASLVS
jgi:hypothetical protein